jgi:hypothetical protein
MIVTTLQYLKILNEQDIASKLELTNPEKSIEPQIVPFRISTEKAILRLNANEFLVPDHAGADMIIRRKRQNAAVHITLVMEQIEAVQNGQGASRSFRIKGLTDNEQTCRTDTSCPRLFGDP